MELGDIRNTAGSKIEDVQARTKIIEYLTKLAGKAYDAMDPGETMRPFFVETVKGLLLRSIDMLWVEHLDAIEHMRTGIGLRGYGQRDPLVEYKREAYRMFNELMQAITKQIVYAVFKIAAARDMAAMSLMDRQGVRLSAPSKSETGGTVTANAEEVPAEKVGRNDPCPCGSGKKYKKCHGT
jgi:preprotein translocase subunit SecA